MLISFIDLFLDNVKSEIRCYILDVSFLFLFDDYDRIFRNRLTPLRGYQHLLIIALSVGSIHKYYVYRFPDTVIKRRSSILPEYQRLIKKLCML